MTVVCPCCGHALSDRAVPLSALPVASLTWQRRRIVDALISAYPRPLTIVSLIDAVYYSDPTGGPENAENTLRVQVSHLRKELERYGWTIPSVRPGRGNFQQYRLEPLP